MKKYLFLIFHEQYTEFLDFLKKAGVMHIVQRNEDTAEDEQLRNKMQLAFQVKKAIGTCEAILGKEHSILREAEKTDIAKGMEILNQYEKQQKDIELIKQSVANMTREMQQMEVWGDFSFQRINELGKEGYHINFFSCNERKYQPEWEEQYNAFRISSLGTSVYFITITKEDKIDIDADPIKTNGKTSSEINADIKKANVELKQKEDILKNWIVNNLNTIKRLALLIEEDIDLSNVKLCTEKVVDGRVMILEGYCPIDAEENLNQELDSKGVYYEVSEPKYGENIPVKLKNSKYTKLFEPITKLYSLPNYSELDPTPFFAPFFMLFFGLCLGDGGYGVLIIIAATLAKTKLAANMKPFASLFQWLGAMTLLAGLLTGSFFGIALDSVTWPWLANVKHMFLTSKNYKESLGGYDPMMLLSLAIGLLQIFFGMGINAAKIIKQHGIKYALAPIAWIVGLIGSAITFGLPILGVRMPDILSYLFISFIVISIILILFYNSPDSYSSPIKGFFGNIGSALWATYNMATGLLGDTLSYVRLFALGLTGSILGGVFNQLAITFSEGLPIGINWLVMLFILLFGHSLNFALNMIGAFVHPLRLTFVEFYKNSGFEGGGQEYKPFKQRI